jgi:tetratricopeptide (TPR) repeat protein
VAGRLDEARWDLEQAVAQRPRDARALCLLGNVLGLQGRFGLGVECVRRAVAAGDRSVAAHRLLAELLMNDGRPDEALECAKKATRLDTKDGAAWRAVADCHEKMRRIDQALEAIETALALAPDDGASIVRRARLLREAGRLDEARRAIDEAIAVEWPADVAASLHRERGMILDRLGAFDEAFEAFATRGRLEAARPVARSIDEDEAFDLVDRLRAGFTAEHPRRFDAGDFDGGHPRLAFLVGFPRSGTTMTEQVLAAHPAIRTSDEAAVLEVVWKQLHAVTGEERSTASALARIDRDEALALRAFYWTGVRELVGAPVPAGALLVDKMPLNIMYAGMIDVLFPDAKLIVALRDPRDVCLSNLMQEYRLNIAMKNFLSLERTTLFYERVMSLWLALRGVIHIPFIEVRYEDTVRDLEAEARRMLAHLGVPWDDRVLAFHERARERQISTPSFAAVAAPVHVGAVARWRKYERHLAPWMDRLRPFVEAFGYDAEPAPAR